MGIKMVYQGSLPEEKPLEGTCANCGTKIECLQGDLIHSQGMAPGHVNCPFCEKWIYPKDMVKFFREREIDYDEGNRG